MYSRAAWRTAPRASFFLRPHAAPRPLPRSLPQTSVRTAYGGSPRQGRYRSSNRIESIASLWKTSQAFRVGVAGAGAGGVVFYVANLETVPGSGRRRFNCIGPEFEKNMAKDAVAPILKEYSGRILPEWAPETRMVMRVMERLIPNSGIEDGEQWEIRVIKEDQPNAFVMPGNKVFVFTGILPICQNEDGLAAVLGHEIAHNLAHHSSENLSRLILLVITSYIVSITLGIGDNISGLVLDLAFNRPGSRAQEAEADYLGLLMMAKSCYDPQEAAKLWERMQQRAGPGSQIPQFLSTHPSDRNRVAKITEWLPEAMQKRDASECAFTMGFADPFREAMGAFR